MIRIWDEGRLVPYDQATIHVLSHAVQRGSAVFDVLRVVETDVGPSALGLRGHVARFVQSMGLMGMDPHESLAELESAVAETVLANPGSDIVKLVAAWDEVPLRSLPVTTVPRIWVAALESHDDQPPAVGGVKMKTASAPKMPADILPPSLKVAASYTAGVRERMAAVGEGFDDVVFRTTDGLLAEGTTQSMFVVAGDSLLVPPLDSVLDGITRRFVLDVAHHLGHPAEVRAIDWIEVEAADELFMSSTNYPVLPVAQLDGRVLEAPGPISSKLRAEIDDVLGGRHELSARWLTPLRPLE